MCKRYISNTILPDDKSIARCNVCSAKISLGDPNTGKKLGNGSLHSHLRSFHKEKAKEVEDRAKKVAADKLTVKGLSDETVRGSKMVYSARTKQARTDLLNQVCWEVQLLL
jgi:hypothetical protein